MGNRKKNSIKNIYTGLGLRVITLILKFLSRYIFIYFLGEECLGLNGLFTTILTLFSLADLGIGEAITFYLYKPISDKDNEKLKQLVSFYKFAYRVIGIIIFGIGIFLIPFLHDIVNLDTDTEYNVYIIYLLYLLNTVLTYLFFSYPQTILNANQEQHVINNNTIIFTLVTFIADVVTLLSTKNYIIYLSIHLLIAVIQNLRLFIISRRKYQYLTQKSTDKLSIAEIKTMFKDVYSIFVVKLASRVIDSTDNIFISIFLGTVKVGFNSNYLLFSDAATSIINTIVYSFSASVGDFNANKAKNETFRLFQKIDFINFGISFACALCLFSFLNPFITLLWGSNFTFSTITVALFCFNFFIVTGMYTTFMFRQSLGLFKYKVYNNVFAAILNIFLDFLLVKEMDVAGLYLATVISNLSFGVWPFVVNVFNVGFEISAKKQVLKMIIRYIFTIVVGFFTYLIGSIFSDTILGFICRVFSTISIIIVALIIVVIVDKQARDTFKEGILILRKRC